MESLSNTITMNPSSTRSRIGTCGAIALAAAVLAVAGFAVPVAALDDLTPTAIEEQGGDVCPALTAIKYPWLSCRANEFGGTTLSLPSQPAPLKCHLKLRNGECAASPKPWWPVFP
jgi:hypothetical protein